MKRFFCFNFFIVQEYVSVIISNYYRHYYSLASVRRKVYDCTYIEPSHNVRGLFLFPFLNFLNLITCITTTTRPSTLTENL